MVKYDALYENENNELVYIGSFIGKNHYKIKFIVYNYLKNILQTTNQIVFAIHAVRINKFFVYIGNTVKIRSIEITTEKIKSINKVNKASSKQSDNFLKKLEGETISYTKTHEYREKSDDEISISETDSECDSNE